jgi:glycerophosphoryl diester phosphodiesterase
VHVYGYPGTVESVVAAFDAGAYGVVVDVRRTPEGALVLSPEPSFGPDAALLSDVLAVARGRIVIEVKNIPGEPDYDGRTEATARLLVSLLAGTAYDVTVSSFDWFALEVARDAGLRTAFRTPPGLALEAALAYVADARMDECHPHWSAVLEAPATVAAAHDQGKAVVAWAVDDLDVARRLRDAGVDGVITGDSALLVRVLHDH